MNNISWNSSLYDGKHGFVSKYGEAVVELLAPAKDESILDLGCGTGDLAAQIAAKGAKVVGIDHSKAMIDQAMDKYPDLDFRVMSADEFVLPEMFEAVFSNAALHWVLNAEACAKCIYESLKSGGRLVAEFGGHGNVNQVVQALKTQLTSRGYDEAAKVEPWYFPTIGEYSSVLEHVGFSVAYAAHLDRPTALEGDHGIQNWLRMFGGMFLHGIPESDIAQILYDAEHQLRETHLKDNVWYADYKRLRIVAFKE